MFRPIHILNLIISFNYIIFERPDPQLNPIVDQNLILLHYTQIKSKLMIIKLVANYNIN